MEALNNVIMFPREKRDTPPQSLEEMVRKIANFRISTSKAFCEGVMPIIDGAFGSEGIDIQDEAFYADFELLKDALLSLHFKANGVGYYIQDLARQTYLPDDEEEDEVTIEDFMEIEDDEMMET